MEKLIVSSSPHLRSGASTQRIMLDVIIALCPALIASFVFFGPRALILVAVTVLSCVLSEYISRKVMKRDNTVPDLSCIVTGLLLAFNLPVSLNPLMAVFGGVVAIVVVKQIFGGIGQRSTQEQGQQGRTEKTDHTDSSSRCCKCSTATNRMRKNAPSFSCAPFPSSIF